MAKRRLTMAALLASALLHTAACGQSAIRGKVTDEKTGRPIANLDVGASRRHVVAKTPDGETVQAERTARTNENGEYRMEIPAGVKEIGVFTLSDAYVNEIYDGVQFQGAAPKLADFKQPGVKPVDASLEMPDIDFRLEPLGGKEAEGEKSPPARTGAVVCLTDSHGAAGVVWAMLSLADVDPKYMECAEKSLQWLMHVKKTDEQGRATWYMVDPMPSGDPKYKKYERIDRHGMALTANMFFTAYDKTKRPDLKETGLAAARWLAEVEAMKWDTKVGTAYMRPSSPDGKQVGHVSGYSHGLGLYIETFSRAHKAQGGEVFEKALRGILVNLKVDAATMDGGRIAWPTNSLLEYMKGKNALRTGFCFGQAGVVVPLLDLVKDMPDLKLPDGTTPLDLANGALRYLMSEAKPARGGYVWPYMRAGEVDKNPGLGSGVGGIGWAFLKGAQANRAAGNEKFAEECMKYARGAAEYVIVTILEESKKEPFRMQMFGLCGGAGGSGHFLMLLAEDVGESDPALRDRARDAVRQVARGLIASATPIGDTLAWKLLPDAHARKTGQVARDADVVNVALDYGQTGVVYALSETGKYLKDDEILAAAKKGGDFIVNHHAVKTPNGWKFPQYLPVPAP
ncbi:MAG: hypothetical protein AB1696_21285 [Planctomycetota bacterium]